MHVDKRDKLNNNFTVVTPNYNMAEYLAGTIESVLANLRPGDEYFIIDGGSTDGSIEVISRYADRITGWLSEPDHGYADAIHKGFERSNANYQCWINSGDLLLSGALDTARRHFIETGADMIFGDDLYFDEADRVLQVTNGKVTDLAAMMLYGGWTPLQDACFWRRDLYKKVGGIDASLRLAADYDLFLRFSLSGKCVYASAIFSAFRRHAGQNSIQYSKAYFNEREACRKREISRRATPLNNFLCQKYYWWKVRWRVRMNGKRPGGKQWIGHCVTDVQCRSPYEQ